MFEHSSLLFLFIKAPAYPIWVSKLDSLICQQLMTMQDVTPAPVPEIIKTRRGRRNEARNAAIYLTRKLRLDTFKNIGEQYGIDNDRTVRSVFERMKKRLSGDRDLALQMEKLKEIKKILLTA